MILGRRALTWFAAALGGAMALVSVGGGAAVGQEQPSSFELQEQGQELYVESCASCHGVDGSGTEAGPTLLGVGAASADFMLRTGRMPLADPAAPATRSRQAFEDEEIEALVAYVGSLGGGPGIPSVNLVNADLAGGQALFVQNCAACHGATGAGGAVGANTFAPSIHQANPIEVVEATMIGPGQMPRFNLTDTERNELAAFVEYLQTQPDPGGADIGGVGPVPEGFVAWVIGIGALVLVALLVGARRRGDEDEGEA